MEGDTVTLSHGECVVCGLELPVGCSGGCLFASIKLSMSCMSSSGASSSKVGRGQRGEALKRERHRRNRHPQKKMVCVNELEHMLTVRVSQCGEKADTRCTHNNETKREWSPAAELQDCQMTRMRASLEGCMHFACVG